MREGRWWMEGLEDECEWRRGAGVVWVEGLKDVGEEDERGCGNSKNADELLDSRALIYSPQNEILIFRCVGETFVWNFKWYLYNSTRYIAHTLKHMVFIQHWNFTQLYLLATWCIVTQYMVFTDMLAGTLLRSLSCLHKYMLYGTEGREAAAFFHCLFVFYTRHHQHTALVQRIERWVTYKIQIQNFSGINSHILIVGR